MEGAVTYTTLTSPALFISTGSQTFINTWFEGGSITVFPPLGQEASVTLAHCVLDVNAKLLATGNASVNLLGTDYNFGTFTVAGQQHAEPSDVHITIGRAPVHSQRPATLVNAGTIAASSVGAKYAFKGGVIQNDGDIIAGQTTITCNMLGNGTISFASPEPIFFGGVGWALGRLELDGKVGSGQTIDMTNDGTLVLGDLRDFHGTIADFSSAVSDPGRPSLGTHQDTISVGLAVTSLRYAGNGHSGKLELFGLHGGHIGEIGFEGHYTTASFHLQAGNITLV